MRNLLFFVVLAIGYSIHSKDSGMRLSQLDYRTRIRKTFALPILKIRWALSIEKRYRPKESTKDTIQNRKPSRLQK